MKKMIVGGLAAFAAALGIAAAGPAHADPTRPPGFMRHTRWTTMRPCAGSASTLTTACP